MASQWNMCLCAVHTRVFNHYYYLHHWLKFAQVAGGILLNTQLAVHHLNFRQNRWALLWNFDWRERRKLCRNLFGSLNSNVMTYHRFEFQLFLVALRCWCMNGSLTAGCYRLLSIRFELTSHRWRRCSPTYWRYWRVPRATPEQTSTKSLKIMNSGKFGKEAWVWNIFARFILL